MIRVVVGPAPIDVGGEMERLERGGAVATFTGLVRADVVEGKGDVAALELEHYPGATEAALERLAAAAVARWSLAAATVVHRVGPMRPGERIVFVGAASA
ncbi:molybdenum cofactor biosynthesis protein MoaE, partial [Sphingomonas sp. Leaf412]|uniref:molybdenum cofactor biosynthesis protein MoaE n=1 Tax=Sphingomonas sp. Leaf412 TaxID=1736370 RepID=UPI001F39CB21